ncbi:MAG: glycosyltransferase family 39 protein [Candidatus Omnitrophica bacterium]|nr:glycosyltransferase family 39 protein [Candidatus Omnitrophota bacterium]MCF7877808.1 glycosyltransferase family 39 protein [Candidatus Omnitrophota bacterium]MCF7878899.1 glycosyltransferase family 39 protein [Candidatus Omnitrophota bacterium]MCF7891827.1 glycosyltransferase family 39 protein [Candidatus Omnitrophota bacterium]MCF7895575.1 glycosyltransferase family 39 protein [Candidatus Omnitrophota bacterium]
MRNKRIELIVLIFLILFQALVSLQVLNRAEVVRAWDESHYLKNGLYFHKIIFDNSHKESVFTRLGELTKVQEHALDRPPVLFVLQAFGWRVLEAFNFRDENMLIILVNTLFLFILGLSCYGIGLLLQGKKAGFLAAVLTLFMPLIYVYSRVMMTNLPLTALLCLTVYILLKTDRFRSKFFSILLGVSLGISQLTRETFILFIAAPLFYYVYRSLRTRITKKIVCNLLISLGLAFLIAGVVFLNPASFYAYKKYLQLSQISCINYGLFSYFARWPSLTGYFILISTLPLFIGSVFNIKKTDKILLLWFLVPFAIFTIFPNKSLRFIMPVLPAYALLVSCRLFKSNLKLFFKNFYFAAIIFFCLLQYIFIHYLPQATFISPSKEYAFGVKNMHVSDKYFPAHQDLLAVFKYEAIQGREGKVLPLFGVGQIYYPLVYKFLINKLPFRPYFTIESDVVDALEPGSINWEYHLLDSDYLIEKVGGDLGVRGSREDVRGKLKAAFLKHKTRFEVIAKVAVPEDNSFLVVFRNKASQK